MVTAPRLTGAAATGVVAFDAAGGVAALDAGGGVAVPGEVTDAGPAALVATGVVVEPELPASLTSAAASTPSASTATTTTAMVGAFQFGGGARRVRAAAPQRRHQSWSGCSGAPHSGQESTSAPEAVAPAALAERTPWGGEGGDAALTRPP
jgi:hypothetical protein